MSTRQRRRNVRSVDVYPLDDRAGIREFTAGCRLIAELYSMTLARVDTPIKATVSWVRIFVDAQVQPGTQSIITEEPPDNFGFSDGLRCGVDADIVAAPASERPRKYLDWLHARMLELAGARGWDEAVLHRAYQDCIDAELCIVLSSKSKASPDRRHRAVLDMRIEPDGTGRVTLTVRNRTGDDVGRTTSLAACEVAVFRRMARQLSWRSPEVVRAHDGITPLTPGVHEIVAKVDALIVVDTLIEAGGMRRFDARQQARADHCSDASRPSATASSSEEPPFPSS